MTDTYDVVVLGAGSTGTNVAWYARDNWATWPAGRWRR